MRNFVFVLYTKLNLAASDSRPSVVGMPYVGRACIQCVGVGVEQSNSPFPFCASNELTSFLHSQAQYFFCSMMPLL